MVRLVIGALLAAMLQFCWGAAFWAILAGRVGLYQQAAQEDHVTSVLQQSIHESGHFFLPHPSGMSATDESVKKATEERYKTGPVIEIVYRAHGIDKLTTFSVGYAHFVASSFLAGVLLWLAYPGLPAYGARVLFVTLAGVFAGFAINLADPIWFHHPWTFAVWKFGFEVGCWLLAGLVLGALVRRAA